MRYLLSAVFLAAFALAAPAQGIVNSPCPNGVCPAGATVKIVNGRTIVCTDTGCHVLTETAAPPLAFYPFGSPIVAAAPDGTACVSRLAFFERGPLRRGIRRTKVFLFGD